MKKIILFVVIFISVERFCHFQTHGFSLEKMILSDRHSPFFPPLLTLKQPLTFLGAGHQFYAFETADGRYVVKFMKLSRKRPLPFLQKLLPNRYIAERKKRFDEIQNSIALAHDLIEETGLIPYSPTDAKSILQDSLGIYHLIDFTKTYFCIQKKAHLFTDFFRQNPTRSFSLIQSYIETVTSHCKKGICNTDPLPERNFGVIDGRVILLDIGSLQRRDNLQYRPFLQREIFLELLPLHEWLTKNYPQYLPFFNDYLKKVISSL